MRLPLALVSAFMVVALPPVGKPAPAATGTAEDRSAPQSCRLRYVMSLSGVEVGKLELRLVIEGDEARAWMSLENKGLAALFAKIRTTMQGRVQLADGEPRPDEFHIRYEKPDRYRDIRLEFDERGELRDIAYVNNGRPRQSEVPAELRAGTVDPMTAFLRLQRWLAAASAPGERIRIPVFEGRKRLDVEVEYLGPADGRAGANGRLHRLRARLVGLFGFEDGYGFVGRPDGDPNWLDVVASEEPCPSPLEVRGRSALYEPEIRRR